MTDNESTDTLFGGAGLDWFIGDTVGGDADVLNGKIAAEFIDSI